jgi:hypothetical protein
MAASCSGPICAIDQCGHADGRALRARDEHRDARLLEFVDPEQVGALGRIQAKRELVSLSQ